MMQRTVFCAIAVVALGCTFVLSSEKNSTTTSSNSTSTSQVIISPSAFSISPTVHASSVTPSLYSLSSVISISTTSPLQSSSVVPSEIVVVSASPTVAPASETIVITNNGTVCLRAILNATFQVKYEQKNKTKGEHLNTTTVDLNGNFTKGLEKDCNETSAYFKITWNEKDNSLPKHTFSMYFHNYTDNVTKWTVNSIDATFNTSDKYAFHNVVGNQTEIVARKDSPIGNVSRGKAYICKGGLTVKMGEYVTIKFNQLELQPFSRANMSTDGAKHCSADNDNPKDDDDDNTVPIAVGAALGGLVLIVLVAYIVGRRRSSRGYEQV